MADPTSGSAVREAQPITEKDLARLSGVSREVLKRYRRQAAEDSAGSYRVVPGQGVFWHRDDVQRLAADMGNPGLVDQVFRAHASSAEVRVRVVKTPRNPKLVFCERLDTGEAVKIRVKDNTRFIAGMEFPARMSQRSREMGQIACRLPRRRGRW